MWEISPIHQGLISGQDIQPWKITNLASELNRIWTYSHQACSKSNTLIWYNLKIIILEKSKKVSFFLYSSRGWEQNVSINSLKDPIWQCMHKVPDVWICAKSGCLHCSPYPSPNMHALLIHSRAPSTVERLDYREAVRMRYDEYFRPYCQVIRLFR